MKYEFCMIDLETMGGPPRGALVGLGAVLFDTQSEAIGPVFYRPVHLATSVGVGMEIHPETVLFWLRQGDEARNAIMFNLVDIRVALQDFSDWLATHSNHKDVRVYGNGASFDLTILSEAYKLSGIERPWSWSMERCFRTLRNHYPQVEYDVTQKEGVAHNAVDDAMFQVKHLFKCKAAVRKK